MVENTSNAGPFRFEPDSSLAVDEDLVFNTETARFGPQDKEGFLRKFYGSRGGFDFVRVVNSSDEIIKAETNGGVGEDVPPSTSKSISGTGPDGNSPGEATAYTFVRLVNTGVITSAAVAANKLQVTFGNLTRPEEAGGSGVVFDPVTIIPGFGRG